MRSFGGLPLRTPRLVLRPPSPGDCAALFAIFSDPEVMRYWSSPPWDSEEQAMHQVRQDIEGLATGTSLRLLLEPATGGAVVGAVSLFAIDGQSQRAQVGYILARAAWGSGLMVEAMDALADYAFGAQGLRRLEADIDPRNQRSARLLERLGFAREGLLRERWVVGGEVSDSALYGLLARDRAGR